jgi:hypothetical protein
LYKSHNLEPAPASPGICLALLPALRNTPFADLSNLGKRWIALGWVTIMIKNGLYAVTSKLLDGEEGGASGVSVLQDGTMRGGGSIYYHTGKYTCCDGKWKGQVTTREHVPELITKLFARKVVTMGFTGTYTDEGAEFEATALVGKRSVRLHVMFQLLIADGSETD